MHIHTLYIYELNKHLNIKFKIAITLFSIYDWILLIQRFKCLLTNHMFYLWVITQVTADAGEDVEQKENPPLLVGY